MKKREEKEEAMKEKERRKKEERARKEQQARKRGEREASETRQTERRNDREEVSNPTSGGGETLEQMLMSGTSRWAKKWKERIKKGWKKQAWPGKNDFKTDKRKGIRAKKLARRALRVTGRKTQLVLQLLIGSVNIISICAF